MATPYCFNQPIQTGPINFRAPGKAAFIPLTSLAVQVYGYYKTGETLKICILAEQAIERVKELMPHVELVVIVIVPCVLASGEIVFWAKREDGKSAFNSWGVGLQAANGKPQLYEYDNSTHCFIFRDAPAINIKLPPLTLDDVIAQIDSITIFDPESEAFAALINLFV